MNRMSTTIYTDAEASKLLFESLAIEEGSLKGFIQELNLNPFGALFISGIQVKNLLRALFFRTKRITIANYRKKNLKT